MPPTTQHVPAFVAPQPQWQQQYPGPYPPPPVQPVQQTVTTTGLPAWMHIIYAIGGIFTCGVLWAVWAVHWWFIKSKGKSTTTTYGGHQPPPPPPYGH